MGRSCGRSERLGVEPKPWIGVALYIVPDAAASEDFLSM